MLRCSFLGLGLMLLSWPLAAADTAKPWEVAWVGELRKAMHDGDLRGYADLEKLGKLPHLYAVGPVEGLKGEVTVWDGQPFVARVDNGKVIVDKAARPKACFLVYTQVREWLDVPIPASVKSEADLEEFVVREAKRAGIEVGRPFPFLVRGKPDSLTYHVVNKTDAEPNGREQHEKVKVKFRLKDQPVKIVGFYSDRHQGVFTCGGHLHMHVLTEDGKESGHLDEIQLGGQCKLFLPQVGRRPACCLDSGK